MLINKEELKATLDGMDEATLAKAKAAIDALKTPTQDGAVTTTQTTQKTEPKVETTDGAATTPTTTPAKPAEPKVETQDGATATPAKTETPKTEQKVATLDEAAIRKDAAVQARKAMQMHDNLVPFIGEFTMDEMFTENDVAVYGCRKLVEKGLIMDSDVNAGSEIATLTGFLAGRKGAATAKVVTVDGGVSTPTSKFDFRAAYLAK